MRITGLGRFLLALSLAAMGAFTIVFRDFAHEWPVVPKWTPWHDGAAAFFGALLLASSIALLVPRLARMSALALTGLLLLRLLLTQLPIVVMHPLVEGAYESFGENLALVAGAWTIFSVLSRDGGALARFGNVRVGQILFGLALLPFGLSHFFYMNMTAPIIPAWIPFHVPLGYFTGAAHFAAGLGILFLVLPRLAATLEAVMVSLFTLLVWPPIIIASPAVHGNWSEICVSAAISGAAWAIAESFRDSAWLWKRR